jgi:sister chromatid cohesion protein DCC1
VSRFYGEYLLQTSGNAFNLSEFLTMWQQAVPEGVQTDVKHLRGLSLVDDSKTPNVIKYFPEWKLTENIQDRLVVLFALREKWTLEELEPYVEKLTTTKLNANALLTKFSRVSKINGVKHFSSKHGK